MSFEVSEATFAVNGKSISMVGGAKYMRRDIIQIIMPKKSCVEADTKLTTWNRNTTIIIDGKRETERKNLTWIVGLKSKRYTDSSIVSSIAIDVE